MTALSYKEIEQTMKEHIVSNQSEITDFTEGSVISTIIEAVSRVVERLYVETKIGYSNNLRAIPYSLFGFSKKNGQKGAGVVKFTQNKVLDTDTVITLGTRVSVNGTLFFTTTAVGVIKAGDLESNEIPIIAENIGIQYNVVANKINTIESIVQSNVIAVTNPSPITGGTNIESDTEMLGRFKAYINGLQGTNMFGLKAAILNIPEVRSVYIKENFPPLDAYNFDIYVDDGSGGTLTTELNNKVKDVVYGDGTINNPGYKAVGLNCRIAPVTGVHVNVNIASIKIYRVSHLIAETEIKEAIQDEINKLTVGEDVQLTNLILRLMQISYVRDIAGLTLGDLEENENFEILDSQVARCGDINITLVDA